MCVRYTLVTSPQVSGGRMPMEKKCANTQAQQEWPPGYQSTKCPLNCAFLVCLTFLLLPVAIASAWVTSKSSRISLRSSLSADTRAFLD